MYIIFNSACYLLYCLITIFLTLSTVLFCSDDDFVRPVTGPKNKPPCPAPPLPIHFPAFVKGPLSVLSKNAMDVTWMLRRVLILFHPKKAGAFGLGENLWWDKPVSCSRLTSPTSISLVSQRVMIVSSVARHFPISPTSRYII